MRVICAAAVDDYSKRQNLCNCVSILGGTPNLSGNTVSVEFNGDASVAESFVNLFKNYLSYEIRYQC